MPGMTKEQLEGFVGTEIDKRLGQTLDDRLKIFQEQQKKQFETMMAGLPNGNAAATAPAAMEKGVIVGQIIRCIAGAKYAQSQSRFVTPAQFAKEQYGAEATVTKALSAGVGTEGGFTIPEVLSTDFIEFLRPASIIRQLNPIVLPMDQGNLNVSKLTGGAAAAYIGENQNAFKTQPTFGMVKATARKLTALVPVSNDLLRRNVFGVDTIIRDDAIAAVGQRGDLAFIRGDGSSYQPKGLRNWVLAGQIFHANQTVNLANITKDLGTMVLNLIQSNVRMLRPGWIFAPRTWNYLNTILTTNGVYAFRDELAKGTLWGWPWRMSTQIPTNLNLLGSSNETESIFADFADVVIAEATQVLVDVSQEAAYWDGAAIQAAFSLDQTVVRVIVEHDLVMRHDESISVMDEVIWQ